MGGVRALVFLGRVHLYEGHPVATVVHGVRTAVAAGCQVVVLTNAAGGIRAGYQVGQPVLIADHLNLTGRSPLAGPPPPEGYGSRFTDLTDLYSARLRALARRADPDLAEGVYAAMPGPHYETPAEIRMPSPRWAPTWSGCPRSSRPSPPGTSAPRCSRSPWSATWRRGWPRAGSTMLRWWPRAGGRRPDGRPAGRPAARHPAARPGRVILTGDSLTGDSLTARAERWIADDPDERDRAQVRALLDDGGEAARADLADRFRGRLAFGTAGLRGAVGAGPNRMNRAVVRATTAALAGWLLRRARRARRGAGRRGHRLRRPAPVRRSSPTRPPGCWPGRGSGCTCCPRGTRPRCWPSRSGTWAPRPGS